MSIISKQQVQKISHLSRIKLNDEELEYYSSEVAKIITWVEKLDEIDTENITPLFSGNQNLKMFDDKVASGDLSDEVLSNSPERQFDFYTVPKMVDGQ
ncbi:MAG: Asp-tRNA(Asn)/Glu-tRNA(Gln) amidotransferase subunit GatC [Rickettsiales bacterium]|jgi:aspartyl-tRNA(Asn)/glutamyl-tRNA(Gln) amidotransferase subunit C|nr:Asp-tRNA(Asn)/Glu-tRNA(Gln) amidotransferase subunit GatC [Rickettsiales bacterium]